MSSDPEAFIRANTAIGAPAFVPDVARSLKRVEHERFVSALPEPTLPAASGIEHCAAWDSNPARRIKSPVLYPMS